MSITNITLRPSFNWQGVNQLLFIMKLITVFMLIGCLHLSAASYSQTITLEAKEYSLKDIFSTIKKQTGYNVIYNIRFLEDTRPMSIYADRMPLNQFLKEVLEKQALTYEITEKTILIGKAKQYLKPDQAVLSAELVQQRVITGRVTDEFGAPLEGVTVTVKGTQAASVSDTDGNYRIITIETAGTLLFTIIGFESTEQLIGNQSSINVSLKASVDDLDEVVVVGYGTQKKSDLTGSVARADIESFREAPNVNIGQSLQGTVPGLNIGQVDQAGQNPSVSIRGRASISGNQNILLVVDGIVYTGGLGDLNPNDIESIDILKDPSSKAIYGAQAANGVMLITTKTGKKSDKPSITYNGSFATQDPTEALQYLNREEYIQKAFDMDWQVAYEAPDYVKPKPNLDEIYLDISVGAPYATGYNAGTNYDWWGNLTNPGYLTMHNLGINGGNADNFKYYLSSGYTKQKGVILNDNYERVALRVNLDNQLFRWLKIGAQTFGTFSDFSGASPSISNISNMSPLLRPRNDDGEYDIYPNGIMLNPFLAPEADDYDYSNSLFGNVNVDIALPFIDGLNYRFQLGGNYAWDKHFYSNIYDSGLNGNAYKTNSHNMELSMNHIVSYKTNFDKHTVDATFVYGTQERQYETTNANGNNFSDLSLGYNQLSLAGIQTITSGAYSESFLYQMARINYSFDARYLLTATVRRDGFSGFSSKNKFGVFPSIGLGWRISNESFFTSDWINDLKIRVSYGENGNLSSRYSSLARMRTYPAYVFGDSGSTEFGQEPTSLANDFLSWETTTGFNFGLDFTSLNGRLSGGLDYYLTTTTDLLYNVSLPLITGYPNIFTNIGKIANRGIEAAVDFKGVQMNNFSWNINLNVSTNKNEVKSLLGLDTDGDGREDDLPESGLFIGQPLSAIYDFESGGIIQFGDDIPQGFLVGTHRILDQNGDGMINTDDRKIVGYKDPAYRFGVLNEFRYKDFTLKLFINSVQGGKKGYRDVANTITKAVGDNMRRNNIFKGIDYWTPSNPNARYRRLDAEPAYDYTYYGDRSFIRLQNVSLSYQFRPEIIRKLNLKNLSVFVSGKNLNTWTKWQGWDPETSSGLEPGGRPVLKGWSIGIDVTL